jgi:hypothetical protein
MRERVCIDCGVKYPETDEYFTPKGEGRFDTRCKECRKKRRQELKSREKERKADALETQAVDEFVKAANRGGENVPHSCELLENLMTYMGGVNGFAALMTKQYFDAPPGSGTRTKIADTIVKLVTTNADQGGSKKPMEQWTDEELQKELDGRLQKIAFQMQGGFLNVQEAPEDFTAALSREAGFLPTITVEGDAGGDSESFDRSTEDVSPDAEPEAGSRDDSK